MGGEDYIYRLLRYLGAPVDNTSSGMYDTPERAARAFKELTIGYHDDYETWWKTFDAEGADQMIIQLNIPLFSLCEHHLLPIAGVAHIGYIPRETICGLSKLKRVVDLYAKRFQVQERMTKQIADFLEEKLQPRGVITVIEAEHFCMTMRGVQTPGTRTITSAVSGDFLTPGEGSRDEFMALLQRRS